MIQNIFAHLAALLRMELTGVKVVFLQGCGVGQYVVCSGCRVVADRHVIRMYEIYIATLLK
jgi:hypothetical protein